MQRDSKRQESCAFEFDQIEKWGPELVELFDDVLPKSLELIFEAEPPEDVEHAREILIAHLGMDKPAIELRMRRWFKKRRVTAYLGDWLTDEEARKWPRFRWPTVHAARLACALGSHPRWEAIAPRVLDAVIRAEPSSRRKWLRRTATASKQGLLVNFNAYLPEDTALEERVADKFLGQEGIRLLREYGRPRMFKFELLGENALKAAKRFAGKTERDPNFLVWSTFDAWAYWLADCEFDPAAEGLYIGLDLNSYFDDRGRKELEMVVIDQDCGSD